MSGNSGFLKKTANPACLAGSRRRDVAAMATRLPEPSYVFTLVDRGVRKRGCPQAYFNGNKIVDVCSRQGWEDDMPVRNSRQHDVWTAGDAYEPFEDAGAGGRRASSSRGWRWLQIRVGSMLAAAPHHRHRGRLEEVAAAGLARQHVSEGERILRVRTGKTGIGNPEHFVAHGKGAIARAGRLDSAREICAERERQRLW